MESQLVFEGDEPARLNHISCACNHVLVALPPNPIVIHATNVFMAEPQIDSIKTVYELDRQLTIETRADKELQVLNDIRKNV